LSLLLVIYLFDGSWLSTKIKKSAEASSSSKQKTRRALSLSQQQL
jgi:hypothetical protein